MIRHQPSGAGAGSGEGERFAGSDKTLGRLRHEWEGEDVAAA